VILRDPQGKRPSGSSSRTTGRSDLPGFAAILYEGKEIDFLVRRGEGKDEIIRGGSSAAATSPTSQECSVRPGLSHGAVCLRLRAGRPVHRRGGRRLRFSMPGEPLFPSLADDTISSRRSTGCSKRTMRASSTPSLATSRAA